MKKNNKVFLVFVLTLFILGVIIFVYSLLSLSESAEKILISKRMENLEKQYSVVDVNTSLSSFGEINHAEGNGQYIFIFSFVNDEKGNTTDYVISKTFDCPLKLELGNSKNRLSQQIEYRFGQWYVANSVKPYADRDSVVQHIRSCVEYAKNKLEKDKNTKEKNIESWKK